MLFSCGSQVGIQAEFLKQTTNQNSPQTNKTKTKPTEQTKTTKKSKTTFPLMINSVLSVLHWDSFSALYSGLRRNITVDQVGGEKRVSWEMDRNNLEEQKDN